MTQLDRIEAKLDAILEALTDEPDPDDEPIRTLDGEIAGKARDDTQPL